jgi:activating signal cointegrator 1
MKTITICQPYAELIMLGQKRCENRTWSTSHRGWIGIHAGKSRSWLKTFSPLPGKMDFGCLIGYARLVKCLPIDMVMRDRKLFKELHPHAEGPFCWILEDVRRFLDPVPMQGKQQLFDAEDWLFDAPHVFAGPRCRVCGCTNDCACPEGCWWIEPDLCSNCVGQDEGMECHPLLG